MAQRELKKQLSKEVRIMCMSMSCRHASPR
jgi:hypothetical protein